MSLSARLSATIHRVLGDAPGADLVDWMQRVDSSQSEHRELLDLRYSTLESRMHSLQLEVRADIAELRHETQMEFAKVRGEMVGLEMRLTSKIDQRFADLIKWSFVFWVGAVAAALLGR